MWISFQKGELVLKKKPFFPYEVCYVFDFRGDKQVTRTLKTKEMFRLPLSESEHQLIVRDGNYYILVSSNNVLWEKIHKNFLLSKIPPEFDSMYR